MVAVAEKHVEAKRLPERVLTKDEVMPADLLAIALSQSEPWAREQTMRWLAESYETTKDWGRVRTMFLSQQLS